MKVHKLNYETLIETNIEKCWDFFSNPNNLQKITPPEMKLKPIEEIKSKTYEGQIVTYKVYIFGFIPFTWVTEISSLENKKYFVDEQRFGPYKFWHHMHEFIEAENGVKMIDTINYILPFGILGNLVNKLLVSNQLKEIFSFREKKLKEINWS
ncbi:MAG: SRPBCC family protein [Melioribacteraceae bacterium]|nr:SRPBCC family protein [Melioribacteraceae bacterium]